MTLDELSNDSHGVIRTERAKLTKVTEKEILMSESETDDPVNSNASKLINPKNNEVGRPESNNSFSGVHWQKRPKTGQHYARITNNLSKLSSCASVSILEKQERPMASIDSPVIKLYSRKADANDSITAI